MVRPTINITHLRDEITKWVLEEKLKLGLIVDRLKNDHNIKLTTRTLVRNLTAWDIYVQPRLRNKVEIRKKLESMFFESQFTDEQICDQLKEDGHEITPHSLRRMRKQMGLNKRIIAGTEEELEKTIKDLLVKEYENPEAKQLGRSEIYARLRSKYPEHHIVGR